MFKILLRYKAFGHVRRGLSRFEVYRKQWTDRQTDMTCTNKQVMYKDYWLNYEEKKYIKQNNTRLRFSSFECC